MAGTLDRKDDASRRGCKLAGLTTRGGVPNTWSLYSLLAVPSKNRILSSIILLW